MAPVRAATGSEIERITTMRSFIRALHFGFGSEEAISPPQKPRRKVF
jgi:hypothetical protein